MSLTDLRLRSLGNDLQLLRHEVAGFRNALRTCMIGIRTPVVDDRALLRTTSELHPRLVAVRRRLDAVSGEIPTLSQQTHRSGSTTTHGLLGHVRGMVPIVENELQRCQSELQTAHEEVRSVLNSPTRTSTVPTGDPMELIEIGLDVFTKAVERWRSRRP